MTVQRVGPQNSVTSHLAPPLPPPGEHRTWKLPQEPRAHSAVASPPPHPRAQRGPRTEGALLHVLLGQAGPPGILWPLSAWRCKRGRD